MQTANIKPAPGRRVRTPDGGLLPETGSHVELTSYWRRRIAAGDVVVIEPGRSAKKSEV